MRAIVTGATGFLGGALVRELIARGDDVTVIVRPGSKRVQNLDEFNEIKKIELSIEKPFNLPEGEKYEVFFHLAWGGNRNEFDEQYVNLCNTVNCLKAAEKAGCRRFLCTGSQEEYGETKDLITEETPLNHITAYGAVKTATYHICNAYTLRIKMDIIWARVFSVYGEHDKSFTLYSKLISALINGEGFELSTDGTHMWNFLHEKDAARALTKLAEESVPKGVYNVASKVSRPLMEYVEEIKDRIAPETTIKYGSETSNVNLNVSVKKLIDAIGEYESYSL